MWIFAPVLKGMGRRNLYLFKLLYLTYPQIVQTLSTQLQSAENQSILPISKKEAIFHLVAGESFEVNNIEEELKRIVEEEQNRLGG